MEMKIISVHAPKAGGTSMLELWKRAFGEDHVLMDYGDPPGNPSADFIIDPEGWNQKRPLSLPDHIRVVHGHFRPHKYDLLLDVFRATVLRHPVDNLISIYCYWKNIPPQPNAVHQYFLSEGLDVEGLARLPIIRFLYSQTYFGGWDMRKLDFIGRHESRGDALRRLSQMLGIGIGDDVHLNATDPNGAGVERDEIYSDAAKMMRLCNLLKEDIRFYEKWAK